MLAMRRWAQRKSRKNSFLSLAYALVYFAVEHVSAVVWSVQNAPHTYIYVVEGT